MRRLRSENARIVRDDRGGVLYSEGSVENIGDRLEAERALRESEMRYRSVVDNVKEVIFQTDASGAWTFLNPAWTEITGFGMDESLGECFLDFVHPDDRVVNAERFAPLIAREKDYCRHQIRYLTKDGGFRWVEVFARLTIAEDDRIVGTSGTLTDVTERRLTADALQKAKEELELKVRERSMSCMTPTRGCRPSSSSEAASNGSCRANARCSRSTCASERPISVEPTLSSHGRLG